MRQGELFDVPDNPLFDKFWSVYPRRDAKMDARKAFAQMGVDEEVLVLILRALQWQIRGWSERRFVPLPATYLRGRRWEDENPHERRASAAATIAEVLQQMGMRT